MANNTKHSFLNELKAKYGPLHKLDKSQSLFSIYNDTVRIYIRYSKVHSGNKTFYGLRQEDLLKLEGHRSIICFLWDNQDKPLLIPYLQFENVFLITTPAGDGQYKAQVFIQDDGTELYISKAGRFNVEGFFGWSGLDDLIDSTKFQSIPNFTHSQIQTFIGSIGSIKGYDIWIPSSDRYKLDWSIVSHFDCRDFLPHGYERVQSILQEVDVVWIKKGANELKALFEVEHSTPIYSALLRFNDILLVAHSLRPRFSVVANDTRRDVFVKQLNRPTFITSGLNEICNFLEYVNVYGWHNRIKEMQVRHLNGK
jgi:hypothetical protein